MPTQIGQYRFSTPAQCTQLLPASKSYKTTSFSISGEDEDESETGFKDIQVVANASFLRDRDYFLLAKIPQDMNYDLTFNVKLVKEISSGSEEVYQFLKQTKIQRGGTSSTAHRVALYEDEDLNIQAMIPLPYKFGTPAKKNMLYYDELTGNYYLGLGDKSYKLTANYNDLFINASWIRELGDQFTYVETGFRPVEENFSKIVFEMVRSAEDYNIQNSETGQVEYGRIVPLDKFEFWLYSVSNLVDTIFPDGQLERIGIWGRPGLFTMINGEEIRVGPSGAYELDVIPITSVGVVATKPTDLFTIDYSYELNE